MALRNQPYIPLYVQDFMTDEKLRECSAESVGVYIFVMCVLHKSEEYGALELKEKYFNENNAICGFAKMFAKHLPFNIDVIDRSLRELISEKVLTLDDRRLIQKRMLNDGKKSEIRAKVGSKGGNQKAKNKEKDLAKDVANDIAKTYQNTEYENEIEYEYINNIDSNKDIDKREYEGEKEKTDIFINRSFSQPMKEKLAEWLKYKQERRESYKPTGLTRFLSEVENKLKAYAENDIINLINESMANNWQGIIWDRLNKNQQQQKRKGVFEYVK